MHSERRIVRNGCLSLSPLSVCSSVSVSTTCQGVRLSRLNPLSVCSSFSSQPYVSVFVCLFSTLCQCVRLSRLNPLSVCSSVSSQPSVSVFVFLVSTLCQCVRLSRLNPLSVCSSVSSQPSVSCSSVLAVACATLCLLTLLFLSPVSLLPLSFSSLHSSPLSVCLSVCPYSPPTYPSVSTPPPPPPRPFCLRADIAYEIVR